MAESGKQVQTSISPISSPVAVRSLAVLSLIGCVAYLDRVIPGVLAPLIKQEFRLTDGQLGLLTGFAFSVCYAVCGIPLARYADRGSRRRLVAACLAAWSLLTMVCGLAQSFWQLFAARLAVGAAESGSAPASIAMITDLFSPKRRAVALGVYMAGCMLGIILGLSLAGLIASAYGWRAAFLVVGAPGLVLSVIALLAVRDHRAPVPLDGRHGRDAAGGMRALLSNRAYLWVLLADSVQGFSVFGLAQWLPTFFIRSHGLPLSRVALLFGVAFGFGMLFGQLAGGAGGAWLRRYRPMSLDLSIWGSFALAPCYVAVLWLPVTAAAVFMAFVAAFTGAMINPSALTFGQEVVDVRSRATAQAGINFFVAMIGGGLGPWGVGVLSDLFQASAGGEALRWSLTAFQLTPIVAALCFMAAARNARSFNW